MLRHAITANQLNISEKVRENCQLQKFYFYNTEAISKSHQPDDKELPIRLAARIQLFDIKVLKQS